MWPLCEPSTLPADLGSGGVAHLWAPQWASRLAPSAEFSLSTSKGIATELEVGHPVGKFLEDEGRVSLWIPALSTAGSAVAPCDYTTLVWI